ncbi:hypothetical protein [Actinoplanes solisilvae]|uniref:hypothetical protein n=1 Tax=Actinoplanes solisilvae TaxID=2486853 RepID=UPI000FD6C97F|nr:hypothetical protein [Actinoplanes solisilvae]
MTPAGRPGARSSSPAERHCRRLLLAYPRDYRRRHGDEIVTTLLDVSGDQLPSRGARLHLVLCGLRQRFRLPLRPAPILAAVLAAIALAAPGAIGGRWLGWQTAENVTSHDDLRALIESMGVSRPEVYDDRTAMGGPVTTAVAHGSEVPDRSRESVAAAGWRVVSYSSQAVRLGVVINDDGSWGALGPGRTASWRATKGGLTLIGGSTTGLGDTDVSLDVWTEETAAIRPFTIGGLVLGALAGWLLTAAVATRVRRAGRARRWAVTLQATAGFIAAAPPAYMLFREFVETMRYDVDNPNWYVVTDPAPALSTALVFTGSGVAAAALVALLLVAGRAGYDRRSAA